MRSFGFKHIKTGGIIAALLVSLFLAIGSFAAQDQGSVVQASGSRENAANPANPSGMTGGTASNPISSPMESSTMTSPRRSGGAAY